MRAASMEYDRLGHGRPLLLVHGLGGSRASWSTIIDALARERDVIVVDLPGFGATAPIADVSIATLADSLIAFLRELDLLGVDVVGSSMGARLVLELARRGVVGTVVSLDPGGFWRGWERHVFALSVALSVRLVRALQPFIPAIAANPVGRTLLLAQFSAHPWTIAPDVVATEMRTFAGSPSFDPLLHSLAYGPTQQAIPAGSARAPIVIGWGRFDRVCFPWQAARAQACFPDAKIHWFERSGHFPQWDSPQETVRLILESTAG